MTDPVAFHRICSLEIDGGFLDGTHIDFEDHLNCLIGGRGTGKTSILELLRWTLDQVPDPAEHKNLNKKITNLVRANLEDGQVKVLIQTSSGISYTVQRVIDSEPIVLNDKEEPVEIQIGRGAVFAAEVYSQSQIEEIANDPRYQLKLIDKFISSEISEIEDKISAELRDLASNSIEILSLTGEIGDLQEKVAELPEVTEKLKAYEAEEGDEEAKALQAGGKAKTLREQEKRALVRWEELFLDAEEKLRRVSLELVKGVAQQVPDEVFRGSNAEVMKEAGSLAAESAKAIERTLDQVIQVSAEGRRSLQGKKRELAAIHLAQEAGYQKLLKDYEKEKGRAKERDRLLQQQAELQDAAKNLEILRGRLNTIQKRRSELLQQLSTLKDERFKKRLSVGERLTAKLSPSIRVRIEQEGNVEEYHALLIAALKNCGFQYKKVVGLIVQVIPPPQLAELVQRGDGEAVAELAELLDLAPERSDLIVKHLKDREDIFKIETVELHDRPTIELKDGSSYKDSTTLSTGQKCTTILPILLLESASPLLIDQPEDNLDNAYIYDTVVKSIRSVRGRRQLIFVTHNPNIPVLGDAQKVFVLKSTGQRARVKSQGSVDEVKDDIETILEGGREAFKSRKQRYGY